MSRLLPRIVRLSLLASATAVLMACAGTDGGMNRAGTFIQPYKIDIVQGNFVSKEQAAALKPGMSRLQVRDILGTPLMVSVFHSNRWDYVFTFKRQGIEPQSRKLAIFFKGEFLERFEADELPTEAEFVASLDSGRSKRAVPSLVATEESLAKFSAPPKPAEVKPLPPLPSSYPPLESAGQVSGRQVP